MDFRNKRRQNGAMRTERTRETQPSYARVLVRFGLLDRKADLQAAWGLWQRVCADPEVIRLSMKREAKKVFLPSVAAPYAHGARVLAAMTERQLSGLKQRLGCGGVA